MTADGVTKAVSGLHTMLDLTVTGVEEMIVFYIGMLTNTYLCLITAAVGGSVGAVTDALETAETDVNQSLTGIANDISTAATTVQNGINSLVSGINTVLGKSAPTIDFTTQINELKNYTFPTTINADLVKLNGSIPTFQDVKNFTDSVIQLPFEDLKTLMDTAWGNYTFNSSLLPVPEKTSLTFCSDNNDINNFFNDLKKLASTAKKIFIVVLLLLAGAACIPMAMMEIRRFNRLQFRAKKVNTYAVDSMDAVYISSRPYTSDVGRALASRFHTNKRQTLVRWCIAYCTSLPALFLLSLALAGLFSCFCQWILLRIVSKEVPALTAEVVGFADQVIGTMNNASQKWATDANNVILTESGKLNQDLLGWVNTSTVAVNNTLNKFVDETISVLNTTFGGTPLYGPITDVFNCLIGLKVQGIEAGLTWVHDNAHIDFPLLPNNTMTMGDLLSKSNNGAADLLNNPGGATQDDVTAAINKVGNEILKSIRQEAIVSFMLLVTWLIVFFTGLVYSLIKTYRRDSSQPLIGGEYKHDMSGPFGVAHPYEPRTMTPAPEYSVSNANANANVNRTPYPVNSYPRRSHEDELQSEKHGVTSRDTVFPTANQYSAQPVTYQKEKGGFI